MRLRPVLCRMVLSAALLAAGSIRAMGADEPAGLSAAAAPGCRVEITSDTSRLPAGDLAQSQVRQFIAAAEQLAREQFIGLHRLLYPQLPVPQALSAKLVYIRQDDGIAWASGGEITVNMRWFADRPDDLGAIYHELAHVVQGYPDNADAGWLVEGIADWARYFVYEGRDLSHYAQAPPGHYRDAYTNAARFLEWLRLNRNSALVTELNARLKAGQYSAERDWPELCGAPLDTLWIEYAASQR